MLKQETHSLYKAEHLLDILKPSTAFYQLSTSALRQSNLTGESQESGLSIKLLSSPTSGLASI